MQYAIFAAVTLMVVTVIAILVGLGLIWSAEVAKAWLKRRAPGGGGLARAGRRVRPETAEGVLTSQLIAGEITQGQYLRALEGLAARDQLR